MKNVSRLAGKVAVVTGGSRGIGLATAEALVSHGVHVLVCGRSENALVDAKNHLNRLANDVGPVGRVEVTRAELRDAGQAARAVTLAVEHFGGLDILINNAGVGHFREVADLSVEDWQEVVETNLSGIFYCCRAAIPALRRRGGGWIINISSLAGSHPFAGGAVYCASKAGVNAFSEALMQELRHDDIRVSCVAPGSVGTAFGDGHRHAKAPWKLAATDVAQVVVDLLEHERRSLPSRVEIRPSRPRK